MSATLGTNTFSRALLRWRWLVALAGWRRSETGFYPFGGTRYFCDAAWKFGM